MSRRKFLIAGGAVTAAAALGGVAFFRGRSRGQGGPQQTRNLEYTGSFLTVNQLAEPSQFDVCIVGSGPAGVTLGSELAKAGIRTVVLEAGHNPSIMATDPRYGQLNRFRNAGSIDYPLSATRLLGCGGTSNLWTGRCTRLFPSDFESTSYTPAGAGWLMSYADMDAYYSKAEQTLSVVGEPQSDGIAPRTTTLPPPRNPLPPDGLLRALLSRDGTTFVESPSSRVDNGPLRVNRDLLPGFAALPAATLVMGATVHRLTVDETGHITAARVRDLEGNERTVTARAFVMAAGAVETARRLLLCRSDRHPDGLANSSGKVGLGFNEHPDVSFTARLRLSKAMADRPISGQPLRSYDLYQPLKQAGFGSAILVASIAKSDQQRGGGQEDMDLRLGATVETLPVDSNRIALSPEPAEVDPFGDPIIELHYSFTEQDTRTLDHVGAVIRERYAALGALDINEVPRSWAHHHIGTVRMGANPATSVVDGNLATHDHANLYLLTSGAFPTGGASGPTLSIVAFAHRLGDHLKQRLAAGALPEAAKPAPAAA